MRNLLLAFTLFALCACEGESNSPQDRLDIPLTRSEQEMTAKNNAFALKFFKEVYNNEVKDQFMISPLSASLALSMSTNGAANETLEEMKSTLGFTDYSLDEMNAYYRKLISGLLAVDNTTKLGIANSIWYRQGLAVNPLFVQTNKEKYDAEVRDLDFNSDKSVDIINQWCSDKTNKCIPEIIETINPDQMMFIINALYFKGTWKYKFTKSDTAKEDFTTANGSTIKVDMMNQEATIPHISDEDIEIAELPYGNSAFSMVILLKDNNLDALAEQITPERWDEWMEGLSQYCSMTRIKLPKFKLEYDRVLNGDLQNLGMNAAFNSHIADFSKMTDIHLFISMVKQNTFIEVNEEGTEAAAVTSVGFEATAVGPGRSGTFYVTRPFIYAIKEKSTGAILFMGRMNSI
ncbi:serpin family protein [Bacteroides sp. 214]|uniref:serpin family protein n=1 Tax=Bacteroides sp. 214 TaxID=2302935 RepID=UPI001940226C|nr:serpin family protein [Bacteroides sp. 214]